MRRIRAWKWWLVGVVGVVVWTAACTSPASPTVELTSTTAPTSTSTPAFDEDVYAQERLQMVELTIEDRGITDLDVLRVMRTVQRHRFVLPEYLDQAYADHPLPIGYGQTISQPYIVAWMTEALALQAGEKVLTQQVYNTLVYVHASRLPQSEFGITCPTRNLTYVIPPHEWRNVWLDGSGIILSGYVTRPDFSRRARRLGQGSLTWQGMRARVKHRILEVSELNPLKELLEQARLEGP